MDSPPKLIVFDCDGVLVDSEHLAAPVLADAIRKLGLPATTEDVDRDFRGMSLPDCLTEIERRLGAGLPESFLAELEDSTRRAFDEQLEAIPGVRALLVALRDAGVAVCVASSGSHAKIKHSLELTGLAEFFGDHVFSAADVERGKPHPDLFAHAIKSMGWSPRESVVVEDSLPGIVGAAASTAPVLAYCPQGVEEGIRRLIDNDEVEPFSAMLDLIGRLGLPTPAGTW